MSCCNESGEIDSNYSYHSRSALFPESRWPLRISARLIEQTKRLSEDELVGYLSIISMLVDGRWPGPSNRNTCFRSSPVFVGTAVPYNSFYMIVVPDYKDIELRLIYSVGVERLPRGLY